MKIRVLTFLTLLLIFTCCGCSEQGKIEKNTADWGTIYNSNLDVAISLLESEASLVGKFEKSDYILSEDIGDQEGGTYNRYEFADDAGMHLLVDVMDGEVFSIFMTPEAWVDPQNLSEDEAAELALQAKTDWLFKGGITAQTTIDQVYEIWGEPFQKINDDATSTSKDSLGQREAVLYYKFNNKWEMIPPNSNEEVAYSVSFGFLDDKMIQFDLCIPS